MIIKDIPVRERPVEKALEYGVDSLSNTELLAVILGNSGIRDKSVLSLAEELISSGNGLAFLAECSPEELMKFRGIGAKKAVRLLGCVELGKRISRLSVKPGQTISSSADIADMFMDELKFQKQEYLKVLLLNAQGGVISTKTVTMGTLTESLVHPREVFREAVKRSAAAIAIVHNHPSGDNRPSAYDRDVTSRIAEAGNLMGIKLIDHIIVGDKGYFSFRDEGLMK